MNYYDIPFDQVQHRYQVLTPAAEPEPKTAAPRSQSPAIDPDFMWNTIIRRLLQALEPFPAAHEAYTRTLGFLRQQYGHS